MTRAEKAKLYYAANRDIIRRKQSQYSASEAGKKAKKKYNTRYREQNAKKIHRQRVKKNGTEQYRLQKQKYYRNNIPRFLLSNAKARAKRNMLPFNLELSDIIVPSICPILKIPIIIGNTKTHGSPSVDQIIPSGGYARGNIQIVSWRANSLKSDATFEELIALGKWAEEKTQ